MSAKISVVINTLNEEEHLERAIKSVSWADEVLVCDMHSDDGSASLAKKLGAKVITHKRLSFVEPARNFAISKAIGDWVLVMDPDEEIPSALASELQEMVNKPVLSEYVRIPRKNIIFDKWMKASMWWPDYNIRFFKKGSVEWSDRIHIPPKTRGQGLDLIDKEEFAIIHHHYQSVEQYLNRLNRYTTVQSEELDKDGVRFNWTDLINKPLSEFLGRFFANRGFEDGLHGLALSLLQAFSFLVVYLKLWEKQKFKDQHINLTELKLETNKSGREINYWFKYGNLSNNRFKRIVQKARNKFS